MSSALELVALPGLPMVREDDDIAGLIAGVLKQADLMLRDGDVVVVALPGTRPAGRAVGGGGGTCTGRR